MAGREHDPASRQAVGSLVEGQPGILPRFEEVIRRRHGSSIATNAKNAIAYNAISLDNNIADIAISRSMTTLPAYLTRRGESQTAFAARSGLTDSTLSRVLSGKISPSAEVVEKVRWATEGPVPPDDLSRASRRTLGLHPPP